MDSTIYRAFLLLAALAIAHCQKKGKENAFDVILEGHHGKGAAPGNFSLFVKNSSRICLKTRFTMAFDIEYFAREPMNNRDYIELKKGTMPPVTTVGGRCMNETDTPFIYVQWDNGYYTLNITFNTRSDATVDMWYIQSIEFIYDMNNTREFPYVAHASDRIRKRAVYSGHLFETPVGMSAECTGPIRVTLTNDDDVYEVYLYMRHMQFQPTQIFDNQFSIAKPCASDLEPQGPTYSPHLHVVMAMVLLISVLGMTGSYSIYRRYRIKLAPIPSTIFASFKNGGARVAGDGAQLFPSKEPTYD